MSDLLTDSGDAEDDPRRRATWGLLVLALLATLVVAVMVFFVGTSGGSHQNHGLAGNGATTEPAPSATRTSSAVPASPTRSVPRSTHPAATSTANPCPSAAPCAVTGDAGQAVAALNSFRVSHGRSPVPGAATSAAQQCALREGGGPTCEPHYTWEPVPTQDGARVISMIAGRGDGAQWLLDPAMSSFSVGWAYTPGPHGGVGHYGCAILKVG